MIQSLIVSPIAEKAFKKEKKKALDMWDLAASFTFWLYFLVSFDVKIYTTTIKANVKFLALAKKLVG